MTLREDLVTLLFYLIKRANDEGILVQAIGEALQLSGVILVTVDFKAGIIEAKGRTRKGCADEAKNDELVIRLTELLRTEGTILFHEVSSSPTDPDKDVH